jgi:hypothetical protein
VVTYRAKSPAGVRYKIDECRFFLTEMVEREKGETDANRIRESGYALSAFMSAFRSALYRLRGVVEKQRAKLLWAELEASGSGKENPQ